MGLYFLFAETIAEASCKRQDHCQAEHRLHTGGGRMIRMLQKKFVLTAMIAITALILLLLGAVNIGNVVLTSRETTQTLQTI